MRLLFLGDIVGSPGRKALRESLGELVGRHDVDFVVANGENAAGGFGITPKAADQIFATGVHVLTSGNHIWDKKEALAFIEEEPRLLRPANYPEGAPGRGEGVFVSPSGPKVAVLNLSGRVFMAALDCPFRHALRRVEALRRETPILIVDFHAEATSEKIAMGRMLDGRVTAVLGTHTHVQTADERLLPGGTAYITDVGMTGPKESVIGTDPEIVIGRFLSQMPARFETAKGDWQLDAVLLDIEDDTGRPRSIERLREFRGR